ncbi:MAG: mechanosensitive ion channel protein MscS, partial [Cyanobacteriota bacterium]
MNSVVMQALGWLGFLNRPFVLEQLLVAGLVFALLGHLRRRPRWRGVPAVVVLLLGLLIAIAVAAALGRRFGLLLLAAQIQAAFLGLLLVERLLLRRWLPQEVVRQLETRFLRPAFVLVVALVLLDAVASLSDLATLPLGTWFGSQIQLGTFFTVVVVLYFV